VYSFRTAVASLRDADGDGIDNALDVCALVPNPEWNPRAVDTADDFDSDGLPNACDPNVGLGGAMPQPMCPSGYSGNDEDQDCVPNRADNCPTVNQLSDPSSPPSPDNPPRLRDTDGDYIGDACDPDAFAVNGENIGYCLKHGVPIGEPGGVPTTSIEEFWGSSCAPYVFIEVPAPLPAAPAAPASGGGQPAPAVLPVVLPATGGQRGAGSVPLGVVLGGVATAATAGIVYTLSPRRRRRR
jgi:hypothetical protein